MAVSEKEGQKRELTRRGSHESDLMLREYSWTHWVITTPILISSFSICCQTASLRNKETEQLRGKWIHFKDAEAADKWKSSCRRRNECWQKQQNKLQGRVLFHLHVCLSDRWLINTGKVRAWETECDSGRHGAKMLRQKQFKKWAKIDWSISFNYRASRLHFFSPFCLLSCAVFFHSPIILPSIVPFPRLSDLLPCSVSFLSSS